MSFSMANWYNTAKTNKIKFPAWRSRITKTDTYKSWKCFKCGYVMNRKNTKIQARTISIKETQYVIDILDKKKEY